MPKKQKPEIKKVHCPFEIVTMPLSELKENPKNPRSIKDSALKGLVASIEEFGVIEPIIWNKRSGFIVGGHQRKKAMEAAGYKDAQVVVVDFDEKKELMANLSLNNPKIQGEFTLEAMPLLAELSELFPDLAGALLFDDLKFDLDELAGNNGGKAGLTDDNAVPEPPKVAKTKTGDLYALGQHRLLCGDSTKSGDVARLMDGEKADLILTDPPYGINIVKVKNGKSSATIGGTKSYGSVGGGGKSGAMYPFGGVKKGRVVSDSLVKAKEYYPIVGDDKPFDPKYLLELSKNQIIFGGNYFASKLPDGKAWIVWDKDVSGNFSEVELAWTSFDGKLRLYSHMWSGLRREGNRKDELIHRVHPTQKPVGLFVDILNDYDGGIIFDPYGGSGTTLIACEKLNRKCRMMEIDPIFCEVIIRRWEEWTGLKAIKL